MKHFIVEITYTAAPEKVAEIRPDHRAFLQTGFEQGLLLCSGPQEPPTGGLVVARAPAKADIEQFFANDPYHVNQAATYRFTEFNPVLRQTLLEGWVAGE